jgi:SRSO17 transposase
MLTYNNLFVSYRKDTSDKARQYLTGLLMKDLRKNAEVIASAVPNASVQNLQQFISDSSWFYQPVMNQTALNVNEMLGDKETSALIIDESGIPKKGKMSVGVARQYLGCLGKTDNGQVGVYSALCNGTNVSLIDTRLYLPEEWINDPDRCDKAYIPDNKRFFKTKEQLALELIDDAIALDLKFKVVEADAGYGKGLAFMLAIEARGKEFMVDVHVNQHVYLKNPTPYIPERKGIRGRTPTEYETDEKPVRVDALIKSIPSSKWERIEIRDSSKGPLVYDVCRKRVYVWQPEMKDKPLQWWLVVRRDAETKNGYKYSFSNASFDTTIEQLAMRQGQRYWIEHAFEVGKGDCGLDHYEVRGWDGWHRHMALVMMAQYFLLHEKMLHEKDYPLLSARDIMELLAIFLPQKERTAETIIAAMKHRHRKRETSTASARKKVYKRLKSIIT